MWQTVWEWIVANGPKLILVIAVLVVGFKLIDALERLIVKRLEKKSFDKTSLSFILSAVKIVLKVIIIMSALNMLGVDTTSFTTILATFSLCLGLAVQGVISNLCSGIMLIFFKPFKVGDIVECKGQKGVITVVGMTSSTIITEDKKTIIMPNSYLTSDTVINYSAYERIEAENAKELEEKQHIEERLADMNSKVKGAFKK